MERGDGRKGRARDVNREPAKGLPSLIDGHDGTFSVENCHGNRKRIQDALDGRESGWRGRLWQGAHGRAVPRDRTLDSYNEQRLVSFTSTETAGRDTKPYGDLRIEGSLSNRNRVHDGRVVEYKHDAHPGCFTEVDHDRSFPDNYSLDIR
jgi:hypothetical protein